MTHHDHLQASRPVLDPTDARQANPKRMNFRVLKGSMALALVVGIILVASFWFATPPSMDATTSEPPAVTTSEPAPPAASTTQPDAVVAPPAEPGNNPGSGTATP